MPLIDDLYRRAEHACELCRNDQNLGPLSLSSHEPEHKLLLCQQCRDALTHPTLEADNANHWYCLQESIWSITPDVQVLSWRLLQELSRTQTWARELLEQAYLEEDVLTWAKRYPLSGEPDGATQQNTAKTFDANGTQLQEGDSVTLLRNLDVKGAGFTAKQGMLVKNIRLTDDPDYIEVKVNKVTIMLKTKYIKRA